MNTMKSIEDLMGILESNEYCCYGLRKTTARDEELIESGAEYLELSYDMCADGRPLDECELLPGTSTIGVGDFFSESKLIDLIEYTKKHYCGHRLILVAGDSYEYGTDEYEWVLSNFRHGAKIIATINF